MTTQLNTAIETKIARSYTDGNGLKIDVIEIVYADGLVERHLGWTEEDLDSPTVFYIQTSNGTVLKSTLKTTENDQLILVYRELWMRRHSQQTTQTINPEEQDEIELIRAAELAKSDFGFDE